MFRKYGVLNKPEYESRIHIALEKYVKQLRIEAETMVSIAKSQILPAASSISVAWRRRGRHQGGRRGCEDTTTALREFVELVTEFRSRTAEVERLAGHHDADPGKHAAQINRELKPAMARLRETGERSRHVAADLWPLPNYRNLLFLK